MDAHKHIRTHPTHQHPNAQSNRGKANNIFMSMCACLLNSCQLCHFLLKRKAVECRVVFQFLAASDGRSATRYVRAFRERAPRCKVNKTNLNEVRWLVKGSVGDAGRWEIRVGELCACVLNLYSSIRRFRTRTFALQASSIKI